MYQGIPSSVGGGFWGPPTLPWRMRPPPPAGLRSDLCEIDERRGRQPRRLAGSQRGVWNDARCGALGAPARCACVAMSRAERPRCFSTSTGISG